MNHNELPGLLVDDQGLRLRAKYETERESTLPLSRQRDVVWGTPWITMIQPEGEDIPFPPHFRWGMVLPYSSAMMGMLNQGHASEELRDGSDQLLRRYDRGWRLSVTACECLPGEYNMASIHYTSVWPVSFIEYGYAESVGFDPDGYRGSEWYGVMVDRLRREWKEGVSG